MLRKQQNSNVKSRISVGLSQEIAPGKAQRLRLHREMELPEIQRIFLSVHRVIK